MSEFDGFHIDGVLNLFGSHVRDTIEDFRKVYFKKEKYYAAYEKLKSNKKLSTKRQNLKQRLLNDIYNYESAYYYIYKGGLQADSAIGFPIDPNYVQRVCKLPEDDFQKLFTFKNKED
jgi:hypothetical protein